MSRVSIIKSQFDQWAPSYDQTAQRWQYTADLKVAQAVMRHKQASECSRLVDLGTGTGGVLRRLSGYFGEAVGVDISDRMMEHASIRAGNIRFITQDLTEPAWDQGMKNADVVTAAGLMEHISGVQAFVGKVADIMNDSSIGVVTYEKLVPRKKTMGSNSYRHSDIDVKEGLECAGLRILEQDTFTGYVYCGRPIEYGLVVFCPKKDLIL